MNALQWIEATRDIMLILTCIFFMAKVLAGE